MPAPHEAPSRLHTILLVTVALCVIGSLYAATFSRSQSAKMTNDETVYLDSARSISETGCPVISVGPGGLFLDNPPLVPYVTAIARRAGAIAVPELRAASVTLWSLAAYAGTYIVAARMFGMASGLIALVSIFTVRRFMISAAFVELDVPLAAVSMLFLGCLYVAAHGTTDAARRCAGIGCALWVAAAVWIKYQGVLLPLMGLAYLVLASGSKPGVALRRHRVACMAMLVSTAASLFAWYAVADQCGGDLLSAINYNVARVSFETNEPWFHQPLLGHDGYWSNIARMLGPVLCVGLAVAVGLWGRRWISDPRLRLLGFWILINFVFCSVIGLRAERYFYSASLAIAVVVGSLATREAYENVRGLSANNTWLRALRASVITAIVSYSSYAAGLYVTQTTRVTQQAPNNRYETLADVARWTITKDQRLITTSPQIAYLSDRNYYMSHWRSEGSRWLETVSDPNNRVALIVFASSPNLHPLMTEADRERVTRYVTNHFAEIPLDDVRAQVFRRVSY